VFVKSVLPVFYDSGFAFHLLT